MDKKCKWESVQERVLINMGIGIGHRMNVGEREWKNDHAMSSKSWNVDSFFLAYTNDCQNICDKSLSFIAKLLKQFLGVE